MLVQGCSLEISFFWNKVLNVKVTRRLLSTFLNCIIMDLDKFAEN